MYEPTEEPFVTWEIDGTTAGKLAVIRRVGLTSVTNEYSDLADGVLALNSGNGGRYELIQKTADWTLRVAKTNAQGQVDSEVKEWYNTGLPWKAVSKRVVDPSGAALTTEFEYWGGPQPAAAYGDKYGKLKREIHPDGSIESNDYFTVGDVFQGVTVTNWTAWRGFKRMTGRTWKNGGSQETYFGYSPVAVDDKGFRPWIPRMTLEKINGVTVGLGFTAVLGKGSVITQIEERACSQSAIYGDAGNLRSTTVLQVFTDGRSDRVLKRIESDGRMQTYTYQTLPGGGLRRNAVQGTVDHPLGIANRTFKIVTDEDALGRVTREERHVFNGTGYELVAWTDYTHDALGRVIGKQTSDGLNETAQWGCCGKEQETDTQGQTRFYEYDALRRLSSVVKSGADDALLGQYSGIVTNELVMDYTYDSAGRRLTETRSGGGLSLTRSMDYDVAGRTILQIDEAGLVTTWEYQQNGRVVIMHQPGGSTTVTENYADGSTRSVTGTAVVAQFYDYGVNSDGTRWTQVYTGPEGSNSLLWVKTTTDLAGRVIREERPGFGSSVVTNTYEYNGKGQLFRTTTFGSAATLYAYNELGEQIRAGLDLNANGTLDLAGPDRISETDQYNQKDGVGNWWSISVSRIYAGENSAVAVTNSIQKTRLSGLGTSLTAETASMDLRGNETWSRSYVDPMNKLVRQIVDYPDSTNDAVSITINGLQVCATGKTGLQTAYLYDGLERQIGVVESRIGLNRKHYNGSQVDWIEDAAGNRTCYGYDASSGRQVAVTNALGLAVYSEYDAAGRTLGTWGATYPVAYEYDAWGRMSAMYTYRGTNEIDTYASLLALKPQMDRTQWFYEPATGLLTNKLYADTNGVAYTYTPDGKLKTRTWARGVTTTYSYTNSTGELIGIDYSDSTPDVAFTFDRLGRQKTVTDAQGTRTFHYSADTLALIREELPGVGGVTNLLRTYDAMGRASGIGLDSSYAVSYGFDGLGRFSTVTAAVAGQTQQWQYSYVAQSGLIAGVSNSVTSRTLAYEPHRNLLTDVQHRAGANLVSRYQYVNDSLGRRTARVDTIQSLVETNVFAYNPRSELTGADMGTNTFDYAYDPIGNRRVCTNNGFSMTYTANSLNQYTRITNSGLQTLSYDSDGNLTNDGSFAYTWDAENRLKSVSDGSTAVTFGYDYMSRRIQKVVSGAGAPRESRFVYDGWNLIAEEVNATPSSRMNYFVSGLDLSGSLQGAGGIGGLLSGTFAGATVFYCHDGNGNVTELVGTNGATVATYTYDPFGRPIQQTGGMADVNPFRFSTKYTDDETGLVYYGYRYYASELGRWLSRDPIGERRRFSLYQYVENQSIGRYDVLGRLSSGTLSFGYITSVGDTEFAWTTSSDEIDVTGSFGASITYYASDVSTVNTVFGATSLPSAPSYSSDCTTGFCVVGTPIDKWYGKVLSKLGIDHVDITYDKTVFYVGLGGDPGRAGKTYLDTEVVATWKLTKKTKGTLAWGTGVVGKECSCAKDDDIKKCIVSAAVPPTYNCQGSAETATRGCCLDGFSTVVSSWFPTW